MTGPSQLALRISSAFAFQLSVKSNPRNHLYRTIERNGNTAAWKGEQLNDIASQLDDVAMGIVTHGDAFDQLSSNSIIPRARSRCRIGLPFLRRSP